MLDEDRERLLTVLHPYQIKKLNRDKNKGGWTEDGFFAILARIRGELDELEDAFVEGKDPQELLYECADAQNFTAMLADNIKGGRYHGS